MSKANRKNQPTQQPEDLPGQAVDLQAEAPDEGLIDVEGPVVIQPTAEELIAKYGNKSNAIRALAAEGKTRSETAKLLGIRYQHVNNVLGQILKREIKKERDEANGKTEQLASIEDRGPEGDEMSQEELDAQ
jgi:hypothetical protein